jgi:HAD superfamily hydrolase (TIGR01509 family)
LQSRIPGSLCFCGSNKTTPEKGGPLAVTPAHAGRLKALLFDLDGTLYDLQFVRRRVLMRLATVYAVRPVTGFRVARVLSAYRRGQDVLRSEAADCELAEAQFRFAAAATRESDDFVRQTVVRWMEREPLTHLHSAARPGLAELLVAARRDGIRLAVCSDYPAAEKLTALGVTPLFDTIVCAQDACVQRFKPDPRMLNVALERLGISAAAALFIGDRVEIDGAAAAAAGIRFRAVTTNTNFTSLQTELVGPAARDRSAAD